MLKERLYKSLKGRRYLIVLDDVWSTDVWDDMYRIFPNDCNGSRILLTTRLSDVAHYVGNSGYIHEMQFLNVDLSWNILQKRVFAQEFCPPELEDIGKFIASKCRGLPLAIVVIAGILSDVRAPQYWKKVATNVGSILCRDEEHLSNILFLSFNHLSHQLKACFLYMGSFPEDYQINIFRLTWLWTAEGFLKSVGGSKTIEQVAEECLEGLVKRNLVLITKRRASGHFKYCAMHDLERNFCRERALLESFFHGIDSERHLSRHESENVRRIIPSFHMFKKPRAGTCKPVRSVVWFDSSDNASADFLERSSFKLLKVLDIAYARHFIPFEVSQMFHLKHLTLHLDRIHKNYPLSPIFKLPNLETLIIYGPRYFCISLPAEFWQMPQLKRLLIGGMLLPPIPTVGRFLVQKLESLHTLETVENFIFTKEAIEMIPNLRKVKVRCVELEANDIWKQYCLNNLVHLSQLEELKINFYIYRFPFIESYHSSFALPLNLKKVSLSGCRLSWKELTVVGSLPCLQVLRLRYNAFVGKVWESTEGEFLQLKFLLLERLQLQYWRADSTHFPCLEHLKINECSKLEEIPSETGDIPTLKFIAVCDSKLAGDSAKQILEEQRGNGNDGLQVLVRHWE